MSDLTCKKLILECLIDYEEGNMSAQERLRFEEHLSQCPPCGRFLATYRATGRTLKMLKPKDIPPDLAREVIAFVRSRRGKKL